MNTEDGSQEARPPSVEWRTYRGHDWLLVEARGSHMAGLCIGYGELNESVADMGTLRYLAAALRAELARPVEIGPGRVGFPDVQVEVGASSLDIGLSGELDVVAGGMRRLEELFAHPELPEDVNSEDIDDHDQMEDLVLRFGVNGWTMRHMGVVQERAGIKAQDLLTKLSPAAGDYPHVMIADDVLLIGCAFTAPPKRATGGTMGERGAGRPASSMDIIHGIADDPHQRRGTVASVEGSHDLMTAVTANSLAGVSALHLLAGLLDGPLGFLPQDIVGDGGLCYMHALMGRVLLFRVRAQGCISGEWLSESHRRISRLPRVVSDDQVRRAIEHARPTLTEQYQVVSRLQGTETQADVSVEEVRYAYQALLDTIHLIDDPDRRPMDGFPRLVDVLKAPRRPGLVTPGWRSTDVPPSYVVPWLALPHRVALKGGRLATWILRGNRRFCTLRVVDADHLAYVLRDSYGGYMLVDRAGRRAVVNPQFLKRGWSLRRRLDAVTAGVPVMDCDFGPGYRQGMEVEGRRIKQERRRRIIGRTFLLVPLLVAGGIMVRYWVNMVETVNVTVPLGESVTLSNGTFVRAETYDLRDSDVNPRRHAYVLEMCGGRDTKASNASASSQREMYIDRVLLHWDGSDHSVRPSHLVSGADDDEEWVNVLKEGQCVKRKVAFVTGELSDDAFLEFTNSAGDRIAWEIP